MRRPAPRTARIAPYMAGTRSLAANMRWSRPSATTAPPSIRNRRAARIRSNSSVAHSPRSRAWMGFGAAVDVVRLGDPPPHDGPVGIPVDFVGLDPGPHRRQDGAGEHAAPVGNHATEFGINPHSGDFKRRFGQRANRAWPLHEGLVTRCDPSGDLGCSASGLAGMSVARGTTRASRTLGRTRREGRARPFRVPRPEGGNHAAHHVAFRAADLDPRRCATLRLRDPRRRVPRGPRHRGPGRVGGGTCAGRGCRTSAPAVGPGRGGAGPGEYDGCVAAAVRPGDGGDPGWGAAAEADRPVDHRPRPGADPPPRSGPRRGPAAQDPARHDVVADGRASWR